MSLNHHTPPLFLEHDLHCSEEQWDDDDDDDGDVVESSESCFIKSPIFDLPGNELMLSDEELKQMFFKEGQSHMFKNIEKDQALVESRHGAVNWILKVQSFYSFSSLTAVLAVNYLDRFIFLSLHHSFQREKPWMTLLAAVACLSIAAKVEEIHVPLLLDLQVEETKYVFEAKTIQKMEILILSTLDWKLNPVNPLTFLDQFTTKLGWTCPMYQNFIQRCQLVILLALFDFRNMSCLPSVIAATTMLHVINNMQPGVDDQFENQLLRTLGISKEKVSECYELIRDLTSSRGGLLSIKRKFETLPVSPGSPTGVIDASFSSDSSNNSWSAASSVTSSPEPLSKRCRMDHDYSHCILDES